MSVPAELKYTASHEWVRVEGDTAIIGITDHAQSELGDVVFLDLPSVGRVVQKEESVGTIESVKTVSDFYAPIAGEVTEVNGVLAGQSEKVNSDPYGEGWLVKLKISSPSDLEGLLDAAAYQASL